VAKVDRRWMRRLPTMENLGFSIDRPSGGASAGGKRPWRALATD